MRTLLLAAAAALLAASSQAAEKSGNRLEDVETQLEKGREKESALEREREVLAKEAERIRDRAVAAARAVQDREEAISLLERRLDGLNREYALRSAVLGGQRARLVQLLAVLERIAVLPPAALVARPGRPGDTIRSALLLRAAIPTVEARSRALQSELDALAEIKGDIAARHRDIAAALDGLEAERDRLDRLAGETATLAHTREEERRALARRNARLAAEAKDLRELLERLESARPRLPPQKPPPPERAERAPDKAQRTETAERPAPPTLERPAALRSFGQARGQMVQPARGQIVRAFGQDGPAGVEKGLTIETRAEAQVVAPFDGQVVFAGPFRGYGLILIVDHGDGYHSLLAGLTRIDGAEGQWVVAGEPVGLMGNPGSSRPALYVELRRNGKSINPLPWLAARNDKGGQ